MNCPSPVQIQFLRAQDDSFGFALEDYPGLDQLALDAGTQALVLAA